MEVADLLPPKLFLFDEGQLRVELLPAYVTPTTYALSYLLRIKAVGLSLDQYQVPEAWVVEETYADEHTIRRRFCSFSGADTEYWMGSLFLPYLNPTTD